MFESILNKNKMEKSIIIFAPHPDDEVLGCGGTIVKKIKKGYEVYVIFTTDGRNAFVKTFGILSNPSPKELIFIRRKEALDALKIVGVKKENIMFLEIEDTKLNKNIKNAKNNVINFIITKNPEELYYTSKYDFHEDHKATYILVKEIVKELNIYPKEYQYMIWCRFDFLRNIKDKIQKIINGSKIMEVDISDYVYVKKRALNKYESQITIFNDKQNRPIISNKIMQRSLKQKEVFYIE